MKVCVTGGTGMVGACLKDICKAYPRHQFVFLGGRKTLNLENRESVLKHFEAERYDAIIHLAANVGGLYKNMDKNVEMFNSNMLINQNVLEACHVNDIKRGIFCLSSCIYPAEPATFPMDEDMIHDGKPHYSNSGYAHSKRMLEFQCRSYNEAYGREYICVIPVNLYGPHDNFDLSDGHFIPMLMHRFQNQKDCDDVYTAYGTGKPLRQFMFAPDFAKIICEILLGEKYNDTEPIICCNNEEMTIKDVVGIIANVMHIPLNKIKWDSTKSDGCMRKTVSNNKFLRIYPDFRFTKLHDGIRMTYKWFCDNLSNEN